MKKVLLIFILGFTLNFSFAPQQTIIDGGWKTMTGTTIVQPYTTYQHFKVAGNGEFSSNGSSVPGVRIIYDSFLNCTNMPVFFANWGGTAAASSGIEFAYNYINGLSGQQYYFWFQNATDVSIHNNYLINETTNCTDAGIFYMQYSQGSVHNNFGDHVQGKFVRGWWAANSVDSIYDNIWINSQQYSATEAQEFSGTNDNFTVYYKNNTFGNLSNTGCNKNIPTAAITLYLPSTPKIAYSFDSNIVFNTSVGLLDNSNATSGPAVPTNSNWKTSNKYFATMAAAGFTSDSVTLPNGKKWNWNMGATVSTPTPANQPPVANAGSNIVDSLQNGITVVLNGSASKDPDGTIVSYNWQQIAGNPVNLTNPGSATPTITGVSVGIYTFKLTVTDSRGATSTSTVMVTGVLPVYKPCAAVPPARKANFIGYDDGTSQPIQ